VKSGAERYFKFSVSCSCSPSGIELPSRCLRAFCSRSPFAQRLFLYTRRRLSSLILSKLIHNPAYHRTTIPRIPEILRLEYMCRRPHDFRVEIICSAFCIARTVLSSFVGSDPRTVSLDTTFYRTGRWWWEGSKSCTQIDASETDTEIPTARCKEAGHWLGDHKVMVPAVSKHIDQPRSGVNSLTNRMISRPECAMTRYAANSDRQRHAAQHSGRCP